MANILVMQKPGARDKIDRIEKFIKSQGGKIVESKDVLVDAWRIGQHYKEFIDKDFYKPLIKYYVGKIVRVWIVNVPSVEQFRQAVGNAKGTNGFRAELMGNELEVIKNKFGVVDNGIHSSDSPENGEREIKLWFGVPQIAQIHKPETQVYLKKIHRKIYTKLQSLAKANNCHVLFAGGTHNGLAVPGYKLDLDYRIFCPDDKVRECANKFAESFKELEYVEDGIDNKTKSVYLLYKIDFENGSADVAFVPISPYKDKVSSAHLATLMPSDWIDAKRSLKRDAKDEKERSRVKQGIRDELDAKWKGVESVFPMFSQWLEQRFKH